MILRVNFRQTYAGPVHGGAGVIARGDMSQARRVAMPVNSPGVMCRGMIRATGRPAVWIYDGVEPLR